MFLGFIIIAFGLGVIFAGDTPIVFDNDPSECVGPFYLVHKSPVYTNTRKYTVVEDALDWSHAFWDCQLQGLELATILNEEEQNAIEKILGPYNTNVDIYHGFWIAAATNGDGSRIGSYQWFTTGQRVNETFSKFHERQPDHAVERCVNLFKRDNEWKWNNLGCDAKLRYVCQTKDNVRCFADYIR